MTCSKFHFPIIVLLLAIIIHPPYSYSAHSTVIPFEILIQDQVPDKSPLILNCQAGQRNIGEDFLIQGEVYKFTYNVDTDQGLANYAFCEFRTGKKDGAYVVFDYTRDFLNCGDGNRCIWTVAPQGIYEYYENKQHLLYPW